MGTSGALFADGALRQVAQDGKFVAFVVAHFYEHEDPSDKYGKLQDIVREMAVREAKARAHGQDGRDHPVHHQPRDEDVESLEGMETHLGFAAEFFAGQDDNGADPANVGDITKQ